jgi:hypothetical protein
MSVMPLFGSSEKGALQTLGIVLGSLHGSGAAAELSYPRLIVFKDDCANFN